MIDIQSLKERVDLLDLAQRDTQLKHVASTNGGEWAGPCPFCGGRDRFRVQPNHAGAGLWLCRHCTDGKWQDALEYGKRLWPGLPFRELCARLGGGQKIPTPTRQRRQAPILEATKAPAAGWQARGWAFVEACEDALWSEAGSKALAYLRGRGLQTDMILYRRLGYNDRDHYEPLLDWSLPDEPDTRGVWMPRGITIPCWAGPSLWYVNIRRPAGEPKYIKVKGSRRAIFGADNLVDADLALFVEGEFDAMIADQVLGADIAVCTLGSATNSKALDLATWGPYLIGLESILVAYDMDQEGQHGAAALADLSGRVKVCALPEGAKDINDFYTAGGDLRAWLYSNTR